MKASEKIKYMKVMKFMPQLAEIVAAEKWELNLDSLLLAARLADGSVALCMSVGIDRGEFRRLLDETF